MQSIIHMQSIENVLTILFLTKSLKCAIYFTFGSYLNSDIKFLLEIDFQLLRFHKINSWKGRFTSCSKYTKNCFSTNWNKYQFLKIN